MFDLQPPRHISTLRVSPIAARPGEGRFTQPKAATQAGRRELVFMPLKRPCRRDRGTARSGDLRALPICPALDARAFKAVIDRLKPRQLTLRLFPRGRW